LAFAATVGVASLLGAGKAWGPSRPTVVATVNLLKINNLLEEIRFQNEKLDGMAGEMEADLRDLETEILALRQDLQDLKLTPSTALEKKAEIAEKESIYEIRAQKYQQLMERERGKVLAGAYKGVIEATRRLAEREGYDLVVIDNHIEQSELDGMIEAEATIGQVSREVSSRPVLYVADAIDVTEEVARLMNNEFRAARAGG